MADFLTGRLARLEHARPGVLDLDQRYLGLYGQDTWRMTNRVTLNAGVRWEPFFGQNIRNGAVANFSLENFRSGITSTVYRNAPAGLLYPGDPGFPGGQSGINDKWLNFSPRVGLAWDVNGDGRMAVRSSYGLGYDFQGASYLFICASRSCRAGSTIPIATIRAARRIRFQPLPVPIRRSPRTARWRRSIPTTTRRARKRGT
jgi:hypothetical protein